MATLRHFFALWIALFLIVFNYENASANLWDCVRMGFDWSTQESKFILQKLWGRTKTVFRINRPLDTEKMQTYISDLENAKSQGQFPKEILESDEPEAFFAIMDHYNPRLQMTEFLKRSPRLSKKFSEELKIMASRFDPDNPISYRGAYNLIERMWLISRTPNGVREHIEKWIYDNRPRDKNQILTDVFSRRSSLEALNELVDLKLVKEAGWFDRAVVEMKKREIPNVIAQAAVFQISQGLAGFWAVLNLPKFKVARLASINEELFTLIKSKVEKGEEPDAVAENLIHKKLGPIIDEALKEARESPDPKVQKNAKNLSRAAVIDQTVSWLRSGLKLYTTFLALEIIQANVDTVKTAYGNWIDQKRESEKRKKQKQQREKTFVERYGKSADEMMNWMRAAQIKYTPEFYFKNSEVAKEFKSVVLGLGLIKEAKNDSELERLFNEAQKATFSTIKK